MAFQTPADNTLTPNQAQVLAQLSAMQNLMLNFPLSQLRQIDKSKQISAFDMLLKLAKSTIGESFVQNVLTMFVNKLFDSNTNKLETFVIKAIAKSMDANNQHISSKEPNEVWLNQHVLPIMSREFA